MTRFFINFVDSNLFYIMQDCGVKKAPKRKDISEMKSSLAPQLLELMKMLFNVETYRCILASFFNVMLAHISNVAPPGDALCRDLGNVSSEQG